MVPGLREEEILMAVCACAHVSRWQMGMGGSILLLMDITLLDRSSFPCLVMLLGHGLCLVNVWWWSL